MSPTGSLHSTVIDAGKYDGALGIIAALAALQTIRDTNTDLPCPVHLSPTCSPAGCY